MKIFILGTEIAATLNFRGSLIQSLVQKGHMVYVLANDYDVHSKSSVTKMGAIALESPLNRASFNPFLDVLGCYRLGKLFKKLKPDAVLNFFTKPVIYGTLAAKMAKTKNIIAMLEGLGYFFTRRPNPDSLKIKFIRRILVGLYRLSLPYANTLILLNQQDVTDLIDHYHIPVKKRIVLGGIGVNLHEFSYQPIRKENPVTFLFVGRLLFDKGIREFIKAAYLLKKKYPRVVFKIVGDIDPANPASISQAEKNKLMTEGMVMLTGFQRNIKDHLAESSVFVLPSYREGVPLSVQEAMAIGRPVITTRVPGCLDTIIEGESGFFVEPFSAEDLVSKMTYFIAHPDQIESMGKAAHDRADTHFNRIEKDRQLMQLIESCP